MNIDSSDIESFKAKVTNKYIYELLLLGLHACISSSRAPFSLHNLFRFAISL